MNCRSFFVYTRKGLHQGLIGNRGIVGLTVEVAGEGHHAVHALPVTASAEDGVVSQQPVLPGKHQDSQHLWKAESRSD